MRYHTDATVAARGIFGDLYSNGNPEATLSVRPQIAAGPNTLRRLV